MTAVGRQGVVLVGTLVIVASVVLAALAPALAPADPIRNDLLARLADRHSGDRGAPGDRVPVSLPT